MTGGARYWIPGVSMEQVSNLFSRQLYLNIMRRHWLLLLFGILLLGGVSPAAALSVYGRGNYGQCEYQKDCPATTPGDPTPVPPTVVTTPSKLEIAVNLRDGQVIPIGGYTILITPLNGQGRSYESATITIDGEQVFAGPPQENGTGQYQWVPSGTGEHTVVVQVVDDTGQVTTLTFRVQVSDEISSGESGVGQPEEPKVGGLTGPLAFLGDLDRSLHELFRRVPPEVVQALTYILLLIVLLIVVLLFFQQRREVAYQNKLALLARKRELVANDRQTFIGLVSHFLRTPLTILSGGLDLLRSTDKPLADKMNVFAENVRLNTEKLLADLGNVTLPPPASVTAAGWYRLTLWLPLAAIGILLFSLNALRIRYQVEANAWSDTIIQTLVFIALTIVAWILWRHLQLRRRERHETEISQHYQAQIAEARDRIMHEAVEVIRRDVQSLRSVPYPEVPASKFVRQGIDGLSTLITKLAMAEHAKEGIQRGQPQPTLIASLLPDSSLEHPLQVQGGVQPINLVRPDLLKYVLHSLINNAIAYSHENQPVGVTIMPTYIAITNHGDYLSQEAQTLLFKPFSRVEGALDFSHAGMGFELYLDRLIMRSLGGEVEFSSSPDGQNVVTIHLPPGPSQAV